MIRLSRMTQSEYHKWRERSIREYIEENVKSGRWSAKGAATLAEKEFQQILLDGRATRDHFFSTIQDEATKRQVGSIWFQQIGTSLSIRFTTSGICWSMRN